MRILIATGIYPPAAGGPAEYARQLKEEFEKMGHVVVVRTYTIERKLPTGVRHIVYCLKALPAYVSSDLTIVLDTYSVGFPIAWLKFVFGRRVILRTGGDFLWEQYVERTGEKILFSKFYDKPREFTVKEKIIFALTKWTLARMSKVVFSTKYQRDVWMRAYGIPAENTAIIENRYYKAPSREGAAAARRKNFVCIVRKLKWKNTDTLERAFAKARENVPDISLDLLFDIPREEVLARLKECYAAVLVSLGDISPNFILEALSFGKPVILTKENGITDRLGDAALYADSLDEADIAEKIFMLSDDTIYNEYSQRAARFSFTHSYADIAKEFLALAERIAK